VGRRSYLYRFDISMSDSNHMPHILGLLSLAETIRKYEDKLTRATGEQFNLFDILSIGHLEVRTHSPILAELLNPNGSHGQGAVFLGHFITHLQIQDFDVSSAIVNKESSFGELGRIDIVITDKDGKSIFIENKIYAGEQERQLERYHERNPEANLLFLTLNGDNPINYLTTTAYQTAQFKKVFKAVSYKEDIIPWLEACRKEVATAPSVREAITQYIHLIQRLTLQNTSSLMNHEIIKKVTEGSNTYLAYACLRNANQGIVKEIIDKVNKQLNSLGKELGLVMHDQFRGSGENGENYYFTTPSLKSQNLRFGLRCSFADYKGFNYGFAHIDTNAPRYADSVISKRFEEIFPGPARSNGFWYIYQSWNQYENWSDETMAAIISGEFFPILEEIFRKLDRIAKEF